MVKNIINTYKTYENLSVENIPPDECEHSSPGEASDRSQLFTRNYIVVF